MRGKPREVAHGDDAELREPRPVLRGGVLAALVGVMQQAGAGPAVLDGHL